MGRSVLIAGPEGLVGSSLAAAHLLSAREPDDVVRCVPGAAAAVPATATTQAIRHALRRLAPGEEEHALDALLASRLRWELDAPAPEARVDELWCCSPDLGRLPHVRATELSYVAAPGAPPASDLERQVAEACAPRASGWRIFLPGLVLGVPAAVNGATSRDGLLLLLSAMHELKREIEERDPEYFDHHALRSLAPAGAALDVLQVRDAVRLMRRLAGRADTLGRSFHITAPSSIPYADLCERLGMVYGLSFLATSDERELNPVDRLLRDRLQLHGFDRHLRALPGPAFEATYRDAGVDPREVSLDEEAQRSIFEAVRDVQEAARVEADRRAAAVWGSLERKRVQGLGLEYLAGGTGDPPVVILNALGQGLRYWTRLVERLVSGGRRVLLWEPRGTVSAPRPFRLADQVADLEGVLRAENVSRCHLVGWCTGPRVAMEFCLRHPEAAASAVFLNASFKCDGSPAELDTDYEQSLETICRMLDRRPALVASVMSSLRSSIAGVTGEGEAAAEAAGGGGVLARMNRDLGPEVLAPFRTESSTLNYARQLADFWSYDARARAGQVRAPVLLLSAELDRVTSPAAVREAARLFPDARCVQVRGATHYCLYDRPALVADLMERFFADPRRVEGLAGEVESVA